MLTWAVRMTALNVSAWCWWAALSPGALLSVGWLAGLNAGSHSSKHSLLPSPQPARVPGSVVTLFPQRHTVLQCKLCKLPQSCKCGSSLQASILFFFLCAAVDSPGLLSPARPFSLALAGGEWGRWHGQTHPRGTPAHFPTTSGLHPLRRGSPGPSGNLLGC